MAKGCMAVPWGHLLDDLKLFSFREYGFKANDGYQKFMFSCQNFLWSMKQISVIKERIQILLTKSMFSSLK